MENHRTSNRTKTSNALRHIPNPMRQNPRWVNYNDKKAPIDPATGHYASTSNPDTWATLTNALQNSPKIGYVLGQGIACIDLDHCITTTGTLTEPAHQIVNHYPNNLIEISPSGQGLHIWGLAEEMPGFKKSWHGQDIEFYSTGRYITVTGNIYQEGNLYPL